MELEKALQGLILSKTAEGKSPHTIKVYQYGLNKFIKFLGSPLIQEIKKQDIERFFLHLRSETSLSEASLINVWRGIRILFTWAEKELGCSRPDLDMPYPKAPNKQVAPFTNDEIRRLLTVCSSTRQIASNRRCAFSMMRPTANRDKAIILTLLDTGMRVSELARMKMKDLNLETGEIRIVPFGSGLKSKARSVFIRKLSKSVLWRYLACKNFDLEGNVFQTKFSRDMNRTSIRLLLVRIGQVRLP